MTADNTIHEASNDGRSAINRRTLLIVETNPAVMLDYLNFLSGSGCDANAHITLRYVPDKLTLTPASFSDYLAALADFSTEPLERLAIAILEDINNELVPRWVQITAVRDNDIEPGHRVLIEDRQPKWDNPALLARLERF